MAVAVVVPWRHGDDHREAAWQWVRSRYATDHPSFEVVTGSCGPGPWVKAAAVADALDRTTADTLVVADADVWVDDLADAVADLDHAPWVVPHGLVHRLDKPSTAQVLAGAPLGGSFTQRPYRGHPGGGVVILRRTTYLQVPLDPRFVGWGQEDDAWGLALTRVVGKPRRRNSPLWHLWHPPQPRQSRVIGNAAGSALFLRYRAARTAEATTALLEEVPWPSRSSSTAPGSASSSVRTRCAATSSAAPS